MMCPKCNARTAVIDSRTKDDGNVTRRRRQCPVCTHTFTTYERIAVKIVPGRGCAELLVPPKLERHTWQVIGARAICTRCGLERSAGNRHPVRGCRPVAFPKIETENAA